MTDPSSKQNESSASERPLGSASPETLKATQVFVADDASRVDDQSERLAAVLDEYLAQLAAGRAPDHKVLLAEHPELAEQLTACLAGLKFIQEANDPRSSPEHHVLGDFCIIREVGRGGMGAVYEAQQTSLGRRVALKILRFGNVSDPQAIQRFQREAETVAKLHHTNIVPIFALGTEHGVNYYAMQFIDGQSLEQVLSERIERGELLSPETVAHWGLQAAEALAHAHARGVIHRDVKPSNLLIDSEEGRIWLTDFGLAKCLDDVTLSMTGALLGTPRYMSPEQAAAAHHKLDHRTDIYSLGATLYELVTGQPLYHGDSPHHVISQILTDDPRPPRRYRPELPRDLETILMKCLSKDPFRRYDSARQLVDDLRAFLDGRPIAARRANVIERASRWVRRQQRSVALTAGAIAATLLLVLLTAAGTHLWQRSRLAYVMLRTDQPPLVARFLDEARPVIPPVTIPTQQRLEIPAGDYQLQLTSTGRLSQTYDLRLNPGDSFQHKLDLDDQLLWGDVQLERAYQLVRFAPDPAIAFRKAEAASGTLQPGWNGPPTAAWADVISFTTEGLRCLGGQNGRERWSLNLREPVHRILQEHGQLHWPWDLFATSSIARGIGMFDIRPMLVSQADVTSSGLLDFNGDGISDLLLAMRSQACLLAISGDDGRPLWMVARGDAAPASPQRGSRIHVQLASVLYPPQPVADQDNDGVTDLLAVFITLEHEQAVPRRTVELISGVSGQLIWNHEVPMDAFRISEEEPIPYEMRWFYGSGGGYSSGGGGFTRQHEYFVRQHAQLERTGPHHYIPTRPTLILPPGNESADITAADFSAAGKAAGRIVLTAGRQLIQLDLQTGVLLSDAFNTADSSDQTLNAVLPVRPAIQPVIADLDADGELDILLLGPSSMSQQSNNQSGSQSTLVAWSMASREILWKREIAAPIPRQPDLGVPQPDWPMVVDLDGDGAAEVLVPDGTSENPANSSMAPWGRLAVLDGRTGESRWNRQLFTMDQRLEQFTVGSDVDHDGVLDVFVAALWSADASHTGSSLFVDCLSGADGHTLWRAQQPYADRDAGSANYLLSNLGWFSAGHDGWPCLIVPLRRREGDVPDRTYLISAGTGSVLHSAIDTTQIDVADLDADGIDDLLLFRRQSFAEWDRGGTLQAVRGVGGEAWRKIVAAPLISVGDLDGDGVRDLMTQPSAGHFEAFSGSAGTPLWQIQRIPQTDLPMTVQSARQHDLSSHLMAPEHDLNGDGTPDVLLVSQRGYRDNTRSLVSAHSGSDGRMLWQSEAKGQVIVDVAWLDCRDLDGDGEVEIVIVAAVDYGAPQRQKFRTNDARLWLIVVSGRTGRTQWAEPLTFATDVSGQLSYRLENTSIEVACTDLDGDGVLDLILPAQRSVVNMQLELRGISGRDGHILWRSPLSAGLDASESLSNVIPAAAADVDGDGQPEVIVTSLAETRTESGGIQNHVELKLLDGATGEARWQWQTPADRWGNQAINIPDRLEGRLRPVLIRRSGGGHWIAIRLWNRHQELYVLDAAGKVISQRIQAGSHDHERSRLRALDSDGDGNDELLWLAQWELMLLRPEQPEIPLWRVFGNESRLQQILDVLPGSNGAPTIVVQGNAKDCSVRGIDSRTGQVLWSCIGPSPHTSLPQHPRIALLNGPEADRPPHVLHQFEPKALVRRAMPLVPARSEGMATGQRKSVLQAELSTTNGPSGETVGSPWQQFARRRSALPPVPEDPRLLRSLPWKPTDYELQRMPEYLSWCGFYGFTLVAVPMAFLAFLRWQRHWNLYSLLAAILVMAAVLMGVRIHGPDHDFQTLPRKFSIALLGAAPIIFTVVIFTLELWQGHWRSALRWLTKIGLTTALLVVLLLGWNSWYHNDLLQPGERYVGDGWYWIALPILYLAACAFSLAGIGRWLFVTVPCPLKRRSKDARPSTR